MQTQERVLVTGGAGYLGSVLCGRLLARGFRVTALDNLMYGQNSLLHLCGHPDFDFVMGDVRDEALLKELVPRHDVLIPLAAISGFPACQKDPRLAHEVNLDAIALIDRLRSPQQRVVFPCTNSGYGTKSGDVFCTEDTPLEPISVYGTTKVEAERLLLERGSAVTLRLATVFGVSPRPRLELLVNNFVWKAVTDGYLVLYEKHFKRNFLHIEDAADGFLFCLDHFDRMQGRPYNLGLNEANISKEELALKIQEHVPGLYIHCAEVGTDPDKRNYIVSNARINEAGFVARHSLSEGIEQLLKSYRILTSTIRSV